MTTANQESIEVGNFRANWRTSFPSPLAKSHAEDLFEVAEEEDEACL
jgi:hypothetical protein